MAAINKELFQSKLKVNRFLRYSIVYPCVIVCVIMFGYSVLYSLPTVFMWGVFAVFNLVNLWSSQIMATTYENIIAHCDE